ncbi:MAG: arylformamidase [Bacteroidia bacterium]|jgi:arylformamidase
MEFRFSYNDQDYSFSSTNYFDLSTPIRNGADNVNAYYLDDPNFKPFRGGDFVGSVALGGACNCFDITFNAHGNGTHTECVGHISAEGQTINRCLKAFQTIALVLTTKPTKLENGDLVISADALNGIDLGQYESIVLRTLPNDDTKLVRRYSGSNPAYLTPEFAKLLADSNITHLIVDLPSVDREEDGGHLLSHHAFWQYPSSPRSNATITELAYIPNTIKDGMYLLQLQIAAFESDASPSKPILYPLTAQ